MYKRGDQPCTKGEINHVQKVRSNMYKRGDQHVQKVRSNMYKRWDQTCTKGEINMYKRRDQLCTKGEINHEQKVRWTMYKKGGSAIYNDVVYQMNFYFYSRSKSVINVTVGVCVTDVRWDGPYDSRPGEGTWSGETSIITVLLYSIKS